MSIKSQYFQQTVPENNKGFLPSIRNFSNQGSNNKNPQLSIITSDELMNIKSRIQMAPKSTKVSDNQSLWAQRIQQQRKKKDKDRYEKYREAEEEKRQVDKEEEAYRQQLKDQQLYQSNLQIFENQDNVRQMKSKLLLAEVGHENTQLQTFNQRLNHIRSSLEQDQHDAMLEEVQKLEILEQKKVLDRTLKTKQNNVVLKQQNQETKEKYIKGYLNDKVEGQILRRHAEEEDEENRFFPIFNLLLFRIKKIKNFEKQQILNNELKKQQAVQNELSIIDQQIEDQSEQARKNFQISKEDVIKKRKLREQEKITDQIKMRDFLFQKQLAEMKKKENKQEQILENQVKSDLSMKQKNEELERKRVIVEQQKKENLQKMKQEMDDFALKTLAAKVQKVKKIEEDVSEQVNIRNDAIKMLDNLDIEQKNIMRQRRVELLAIQKKQIVKTKNYIEFKEEKANQRRLQYLKELEDSKRMKEGRDDDKKKFNSWAEQCIGEWNENGKNLLPLLIELKKSQIEI